MIQERLEKEKKLTKDLGQAATKLQQLLKATQEQLVKERDTVKTLQGQLVGKVGQPHCTTLFSRPTTAPRPTLCGSFMENPFPMFGFQLNRG